MLKGEGKFPLMHIVLGKLSQPDKELVANLDTVLEAVKVNKITKATLASTMSPGVKLLLS
jgi:ribosomal protein L1